MSDGMPSINYTADDDKIKNIVSTPYLNNCRNNGSKPAINDPANKHVEYYGRCGPELASYLHKEDQSTGASGLAGKQTIEISTIGFALNGNVEAANYLKLLSKNGGGEFYNANETLVCPRRKTSNM